MVKLTQIGIRPLYVLMCFDPGCRFACPGLCACWAFSPFGIKSETLVNYILLAVFSFLQGVFCQFLIRNSSLLLIKRLTKSTLLEKSKVQASPNDRFVFNMLIIGCRGGKKGYLMILAKVSRDTWQSNT